MPFERRDSSGNAALTTIFTTVGAEDDTVTLLDSSGWPTGGLNGDFFGRIEDEVIRFHSRNGTLLSVAANGRGWDSTLASVHQAGMEIAHVFTRTDGDEANYAVHQTVGQMTAVGQTFYTSAANTMGVLPPTVAGQFYKQGDTFPEWGGIIDTDVVGLTAAIQAVVVAQMVAGTNMTITVDGSLITFSATDITTTDLGDYETAIWAPGDLKVSARLSPVTGWLSCDGSEVNRTTYAALYNAIGTEYGDGDSSSTFNLPDYAGKVIFGAGGTFARGDTGGALEVILTEANLAAHTHIQDAHTHTQDAHGHDQVAHGHNINTSYNDLAAGIARIYGVGYQGAGRDSNNTLDINDTTALNVANTAINQDETAINQSTGDDEPVDITPPYGVASVFIKY